MIGLNNTEQKKQDELRRLNPAIGFGSSFAAGMLIFVLGGRWLDVKLEKAPIFTLIGIGLGLLYGAYELWKLITMDKQRAEKARKDKGVSDEFSK